MWNKHQQWQDKKDFDRERLLVANREVSPSQPHAFQAPKPHLSSVAPFPWYRLLVNGTSSSVQQVRRCGGEEVKTSFFITHFRKRETKIRKLTTVQSWLITMLVSASESQRRVNFIAINRANPSSPRTISSMRQALMSGSWRPAVWKHRPSQPSSPSSLHIAAQGLRPFCWANLVDWQ